MSSSIKVAFATDDKNSINAHFGNAKFFGIYNVFEDSFELDKNLPAEEKKPNELIELLGDVHLIYFLNVNPAVAAKIIQKGILTIKYKEEVAIKDELGRLMKMIKENPPPFIKKIVEKIA